MENTKFAHFIICKIVESFFISECRLKRKPHKCKYEEKQISFPRKLFIRRMWEALGNILFLDNCQRAFFQTDSSLSRVLCLQLANVFSSRLLNIMKCIFCILYACYSLNLLLQILHTKLIFTNLWTKAIHKN